MAYDERLAERIRKVLHGRRGVVEKMMFGGLCFLIRGNTPVSLQGDSQETTFAARRNTLHT